MKKKKIVLGLDVSTTTIGIAVMKYEEGDIIPEILKLTYLNLKVDKNIKGIESLFMKRDIFENEFMSLYGDCALPEDYEITDVVIEEPLLSSNNIFTVGVLLKFNALISDCVYQTLNIIPTYISSYDSRKYAFSELMAVRKLNSKGEPYSESKIKKSKPVLFGDYPMDVDKKQVVFDKVFEMYPGIKKLYNRNGNLKPENFDMSDAICCALAYINMMK